MDQKSHESPQDSSGELITPKDEAFNAGCWTLFMSIGVVFLSGVASQLLRTPFGDWIQIPAVAILIPVGLAYVWYSHFVVASERNRRQQQLNVRNDELHD
jgi:hypothetical protein